VYLGHRRFLPPKHPLREEEIKHFQGVGEKCKKPLNRDGKLVFSMVKDLKVVLRVLISNLFQKTRIDMQRCGRSLYFGNYLIGKSLRFATQLM
jgi:hypothetical protein